MENVYGFKKMGKMNRKLYYFRKDSGLEIDFVTRYRGECTLLEVKATNGNIKSAKTILAHPEKYHVSQAIKLGDVYYGTHIPNNGTEYSCGDKGTFIFSFF